MGGPVNTMVIGMEAQARGVSSMQLLFQNSNAMMSYNGVVRKKM